MVFYILRWNRELFQLIAILIECISTSVPFNQCNDFRCRILKCIEIFLVDVSHRICKCSSKQKIRRGRLKTAKYNNSKWVWHMTVRRELVRQKVPLINLSRIVHTWKSEGGGKLTFRCYKFCEEINYWGCSEDSTTAKDFPLHSNFSKFI